MQVLNTVSCAQISGGNQLAMLVPVTLAMGGALSGYMISQATSDWGVGFELTYIATAIVIGATVGYTVGYKCISI